MEDREHLRRLADLLGGRLGKASQPTHLLFEQLNRWWLEQATGPSRRLLRSPHYHEIKPLPLGGKALYSYERSLWPVPLEQVESLPGWAAEMVVCRNLQAASWTGLTCLRDMLDRPLRVRSWGLETATNQLLDMLSGPRWQWSEAFSQTTFHSSLAGARADLFLVSATDWKVNEFAQAWAEQPDECQTILWVDTSRRPDFDWPGLLQAVSKAPPWLTIRAQGWQPWDSLGLRLCQPASLQFYAPPAQGMSTLGTAAELARRVRSVLGAGLSLPELSQWCYDRSLSLQYRQQLRTNSERVGQRLGVALRDDGTFPWPRRPGISAQVREELGLGGFTHGYRLAGKGIEVSVGLMDPEILLQFLNEKSGPSRSPRPRPQPDWPLGGTREELLKIADRRTPPPLSDLEQRLLDYDQSPPGWRLEPLLFGSGMAALATLWMALERMWQAPRALRVSGLGSYFESKFLEQVVQGSGTLEVTAPEDADVVFAESVNYDWELTPLELGRLRQVKALVLDTTLSGQRLTLHHLKTQLPNLEFAVRVFSALKLDQQGLELENGGAALVAGPPAWASQAAEILRQARHCSGGELTPLQRGRLAVPLVLDAELARRHGDAVFANNARLARQLTPGGLLARAVHPSLGPPGPWSCAPFVVLHLRDASIAAHRQLAGVLEFEAQRRRLPLYRGASFGFLDHRHEFVIPVLRENRALFKVAMGAHSDEGVIELLQEVLACADLGRAYPQVEPAEPVADWAAPSDRLLEFLEG